MSMHCRASRTITAAPRAPRSLPVLLAGSLALLSLSLCGGCVEQTSDAPSEEDVKAARENLLQTAPTPRYASGAVLVAPSGDGKVTYLGMDVDTQSVTAGQPFTLTHYFRVDSPPGEGWKLFVHLGAPGDKHSHLNADHVPIGGKYPVQMWKKGDIIRDIHKVSVPASWAGDKVEIYTGLWKGAGRFKVQSGASDGENRALAAALPVTGTVPKAAPAGKRLLVRRLKPGVTLTIDGKPDEPAWREALATGPFVNTMTGGPADQAAEARALWDDQNLYLAFDFADTDVWSTMESHDDKLWTQEAAEVFIDADGDQKTYVELQVSPKNVTFDSWLPAYRQNDNAWNAPLVTGVSVQGTLNKRDDKDTGWTVEMQIPLLAVKGRMAEMKNVPPVVGTGWRANFFRMDQPQGKPQAASAWSPPMVGDFHALDKFGTLVFADENGAVPTVQKTITPAMMQAQQGQQGTAAPAPGAGDHPPLVGKPAGIGRPRVGGHQAAPGK